MRPRESIPEARLAYAGKARLRKPERDLAVGAIDRLHADLDRIAQPVATAGAAALERGAEHVHLEVVAAEEPGGKKALEDLTEAGEEARADQDDDHALVDRVPAALEQGRVEQPGEADRIGGVLDVGGNPLARGHVGRKLRQVVRQ